MITHQTPSEVSPLRVAEADVAPEGMEKMKAVFETGGVKVEITATDKFHRVCVTDTKGTTWCQTHFHN
jgi:hypothetical protein